MACGEPAKANADALAAAISASKRTMSANEQQANLCVTSAMQEKQLQVAVLVAMGFPRAVAVNTWYSCAGDVELAAMTLLGQA